MIRNATEADEERVLAMAKDFYAVSGYEQTIPYDRETCAELFHASLNMGLCAVAEKDGEVIGFVLGMAAPSMMNKHYYIGAELAWWVEPEHRKGMAGIKLLRHIEKSASQMNLSMWSMMALEELNPDGVERLYLNSGYQKTESTYSKRYH